MKIEPEQLDVLRTYLASIYDACEKAGTAGVSATVNGEKLNLRQLFEIETTAYLMYLSASDNVIEEDEIAFINSLMSRTYSLDGCVKFIESSQMSAEEFLSQPPVSFKLLAAYGGADYADAMDALISFYDVLGMALSQVDDNLTLPERNAYKGFIYMLRGYKALNEPQQD